MQINKKMFNASQKELSFLLIKHQDLLPLLTNPLKKVEDRLDEFCVAWLTKRNKIQINQEKNNG